LAGQFRSQHELDGVSNDGQRNILIVELAGRTNQPVPFFQAMNDFTLAGAGAVLVFLRETKIAPTSSSSPLARTTSAIS
jgi:hypothetical protein